MKQNHTRAFFVETAALTLFVLLALCTLVQVFGKARAMGEEAAHTSAAALILQNADADFQAGTGAFAALQDPAAQAQTITLHYAADGTQADDGAYLVQAAVEPMTAGGNGRLWTAKITVTAADGSERYAEADTASYYKKGAA